VVFLLLLNTFLAICVETYSVSSFQINECTKSKRPGEESPTAVFLWTYWNALKGVKLVGKETVEEMGEPDEQQIMLTSLPEAIQVQYVNTKRRMDQILNCASGEIAAKNKARMIAAGQLPPPEKEKKNGSGALALEDTTQSRRGKGSTALALQDTSQSGLGLRAAAAEGDFVPRPPSSMPLTSPPPPAEDPTSTFVHRVQLQRMLDDNPLIREICGCTRAVDVIRRFRVDNSGIDPYAAVAELQSNVAKKLAELEENGMELSFDELETLKQVSSELHNALTESQKEWRQELLTVMQMASLLSTSLIELTRKMEAVQLNHNNLMLQTGLQ